MNNQTLCNSHSPCKPVIDTFNIGGEVTFVGTARAPEKVLKVANQIFKADAIESTGNGPELIKLNENYVVNQGWDTILNDGVIINPTSGIVTNSGNKIAKIMSFEGKKLPATVLTSEDKGDMGGKYRMLMF